MCSECHKIICSPNCPNYSPPKARYYCPICNEGVINGERYVLYEGKYIHWECFAMMGTWELMEFLGLQIKEMEDDYY